MLQIKSEMNNKNSIDELASLLMKISSYKVKEAKDVEKQLKKRIGLLAYNNANEYLRNNNFDEALNIVEKGLKYDKDDKKLISFKENINKQKNNFQRAESKRIEKAMEAAAIQDKNNKTKAVEVLSKKCYVDEYGDLIISGQAIGINSAKLGEETIGFSIPMHEVINLLDNWANNPSVSTNEAPKKSIDSTLSQEDAEYVIAYFYDSISSGDYKTAYSMIGSNWQSSMPYREFASGHENTLSVNLEDITSRNINDNEVEVIAIVEASERIEGNNKLNKYKLKYRVGFEGNKLRILKGEAKVLN